MFHGRIDERKFKALCCHLCSKVENSNPGFNYTVGLSSFPQSTVNYIIIEYPYRLFRYTGSASPPPFCQKIAAKKVRSSKSETYNEILMSLGEKFGVCMLRL
ncbi:hypothetical protein AVEN_215868-1 [Araneus ventricosus]|uniref:Uncharacterized protein n=1 Tax=Araneus ventricosus TaxID=182803 RepID=A0A4Y2VTC2_ARAVE|nr:hypothetical protein AVEN_215868-1 [Araneus ventricosus]